MATQRYPGTVGGGSVVDKTAAAVFIPEIWSDEIIAAYEKTLKMAPLVKKMKMAGKKGDLIHVPKPFRGDVSPKLAETDVNIQANVEEEITIQVDRHFEYSRFIEDIVEVQALNSLRSFYTEDAGYALARRVDTDLINLATGWGSNGTKNLSPGVDGAAWVHDHSLYVPATPGAGAVAQAYAPDTVVAADQFNDDAFRYAIQLLDDADVPMGSRYFVIPPVLRNVIMGIDRYVSSDFTSTTDIQTGKIGQLYGVDVYVSTNCPVIESAASNSTGIEVRGALLFHTDVNILAEQMAVRSQTQYKQERLSTLFTADTLYGVQVYRPESGIVIAVPNS